MVDAYIYQTAELIYRLSLVDFVCVIADSTVTHANSLIEAGKESIWEENSKASFQRICLSSMQFLYFYGYIFLLFIISNVYDILADVPCGVIFQHLSHDYCMLWAMNMYFLVVIVEVTYFT